MEKIIRIEEVDNKWEGFHVITDKRTIKVCIDNRQNCCESWGHLASEDKLTDFYGAELLGVEAVDTALSTKTDPGDIDEGEVYFVNFKTNRGTLQLAVYDSHNGYYGHSVEIDLGEEKK